MTLLPHIAARLFAAPLLIHRPKLDVILAVLGSRIGVHDLAAPSGFVLPERAAAGIANSGQIAVIPIHGTLVRRTVGLEADSGLTSYTTIASQLDTALANPNAAAILLDIDSPGGESGGVFDLADRIRTAAAVKPVWAVANDMAFSAAYALASAATRIVVSRTGGVGSIGVIAMHVDQSVKDAQDGVRYTAVFAGDRKNDLNPHAPMSSEAHAFLQGEVNRIYGLFAETVAKHRGLPPDVVRGTEAGLFFGQEAVAVGLADAVGTFDDALLQLTDAISTRPTLAAGPVGTFLNLPPERIAMNESPENPVTLAAEAAPIPAPPAAPRAVPPAVAEAFAFADAIEIAQTCSLAGRTDLIAGFLEERVSPAQVRSKLLSIRADQSPEIVSRIDPNTAAQAALAAANPASPDNPLIQAVRNRMGANPMTSKP